MSSEHVFKATPTMWEFMESKAFVRVLAGAVGSGKSVCCSHELVKLAINQEPNDQGIRKTRTAIIRNTSDQLRTTTWKTFSDWFPPGVWGQYKVSERTYYIEFALADGTKVQAEFMLLPLDSPDDVRKVLSLELTFAWINEAREVRPEIIDGILMRLRRYPSQKEGGFTRSCLIMDTNMPDVDSSMHHRMENPPENWEIFTQPPALLSHQEWIESFEEDPDPDECVTGYDDTQWWINPEADNLAHLDPDYYRDIVPGKSQDFVDVYLRCKYGRSLSGLPVYDKTFNTLFHVAETPLKPIKSADYPIIIGLDFGRTPAAVLGQRNVHGQIILLGEVNSENMGIETFLRTKLSPLLAHERFVGCSFLVAPDPAGWQKQQIGEVSPVDLVKKAGFKVVRPVTNDPERRVLAVESLLTQQIDGKPALLVSPECKKLIQGFRYGYRYKLNRAGQQDNKPDKNEFSHGHDATQYLCLIASNNQLVGSGHNHQKRREIKRVSSRGWT